MYQVYCKDSKLLDKIEEASGSFPMNHALPLRLAAITTAPSSGLNAGRRFDR